MVKFVCGRKVYLLYFFVCCCGRSCPDPQVERPPRSLGVKLFWYNKFMTFPQSVDTVRIWRGDDTVLASFQLTDNANVPIDLTSHTFVSHWRVNASDSAFQILSVNVSQANLGVISVSMPSAVSTLIPGKGGWDLQSTDSLGVVRTWLTGRTIFAEDFTR